MSQTPRNPFESGADQYGQPAQTGSKTWLWVLGIIGGVFLVGGIVCCGLMYYAWNETSGLIATAAVEEFADDPNFIEKIGTIESSKMNLGEAMKQSSQDEGVSVIVFDVTGDKGSGRVILRTDNQNDAVSAKLVLDSGEEFDMEVDSGFQDFDAELEGLEAMESMDEPLPVDIDSGDIDGGISLEPAAAL